MGVNLWFCINKTGKTIPINDLDFGHVGDIYNGEAFIYNGSEGSLMGIGFLSPTGFRNVTIQNPEIMNFTSTCTDYPYRTEVVNGKTYKTFYMRRTMPVYTGVGNYWGSVAKGMRVATNNYDVGETHTDWKEIDYVLRTDGQWIKVDGDGYNHGFVDTGIRTASGRDIIPFYGSW